ncbi:MAG: cytochrome-c peroxidase [Gemmatimonadetes bacterium]|nr:cytochrome-c peroxidase [Gemmatimonadota bacterium]
MRAPRSLSFLSLMLVAACAERDHPADPLLVLSASATVDRALVEQVRRLAAGRGIPPMPSPPAVRDELRHLGQMLVFDKILSGNRNISCMSCHLPGFALGDGRSLAIGEGATGLGPERVHPDGVFIPRNAPPLFNLFLQNHLFWDGRVAFENGVFHTPAGSQLTAEMEQVFKFGALSAIGLFPVTNRAEMRGLPGANPLADIPDDDLQDIWAALKERLGEIPQYRSLFEDAYPGERFEDMTFAHASNAMAGFFISAYSFDNAPWDRFLEGNDQALTDEQLRGANRFLNAPCSICHNGPTLSDDTFHNVAVAQFGPGKGNGPAGRDDFGRMNVTGDAADIYKFRTTPLRSVELTGPYGHAGEFSELARFIDHYSRSADKLLAYSDADIPDPLLRGTLVENRADVIATRDPIILPVAFAAEFVREVTAFMRAFTDHRSLDLRRTIPRRVPSGLPVDR